MLTAKCQKNSATAEQYFSEHLTQNDYYSQGEIRPGRWIGQELPRLDLQEGEGDRVTREAFLAFCNNRHPVTGETLTLRRNQDGDRRLYYDFTCSAPKSVSILAMTMNDERIVAAHQVAARCAIKELEQFAATRVRRAGHNTDRVTGNLIGAEFLHTSSRTLDPQLHTHFVLFNATHDHTERRWKALETSTMYDAIHYGTAIYRNELTHRLHALGYETEPATKGFEIKGVSAEVREKFSKRSTQAKTMVADLERKLGHRLSHNQVSNVIHQSRPAKVTGITESEVRHQQLSQLSAVEFQQLNAVRQSATGVSTSVQNPVTEQQAIEYATEHIFERASVAAEHKLLHAALQHGRGQVDLSILKEQLRSAPQFVPVAGELSTREILQTELFLINTVDQGKDSRAPIQARYVPQDGTLGVDQRNAVAFLLRSPDQIVGLRGLAGTGKSRTLKELLHALHGAGCRPVTCAPTGAATENLRRDGLPAITLSRLLANSTMQSALTSRSIIVVDEAGMVSADDMRQLFTLAVEKQSRVILCGDTGQHTAVTRGDALRILEKYSRYAYAELTENRRQQSAPEYQRAVRQAAQRQSREAFALLERMGAVVETDHVHEQAAAAYVESTGAGKTALLVSPTWHEIELVTQQVRARLQQRGTVANEEQSLSVFDSLSWTSAEKKDLRNYAAGQVLVFHRQSGEALTVMAVEQNGLRVRRADGRKTLFHPRHATTFDVCESKTLPVARGDKLLLQARCRNFVNGEIVQVAAIQSGEIHLVDGRRLPRHYRTFTHGYAVTSHAAQSQTVQEVLVVASSSSLPAINRRQFYVDVSRGRERCRIFTDDRESLRHKIGDPHERKAAIELAGLEQALIKARLIQAPGLPRPSLQFRGIKLHSSRPDHRLAQIVRHLHRLAEQVKLRIRRHISTGVSP